MTFEEVLAKINYHVERTHVHEEENNQRILVLEIRRKYFSLEENAKKAKQKELNKDLVTSTRKPRTLVHQLIEYP